jgi:hypothetical protein
MVQEEQVRLLICLVCKTIDEVPDYQGPPEGDVTLQWLIDEKHTDRHSGTEHVGNLVTIDRKAWENNTTRLQVLKQIEEAVSGGETGLGAAFYNTRDTFREDAMTCWTKRHNRNPACGDYMSDKMKLEPSDEVKETWKQVGKKRPKNFGHQEYLCRFCPVHSMVETAMRDKRGDYK